METVEIPIVCVTAAAGLGVRGVVITPCANTVVKTGRKNNVATVLWINIFISCVLSEENINLLRLKTRLVFIFAKP